MKVFVSWSGDTSRELADAFQDGLSSILQAVKPYFTHRDIDKGARWAEDISARLSECDIGVFILTPDNLNSQWMMFEAGAISRAPVERARVCSVLFGLKQSDVSGPLAQFQMTEFNESDIRKLIEDFNIRLGENKLTEKKLEEQFGVYWPRLKGRVDAILAEGGAKKSPPGRTDREILEEILLIVRGKGARSATTATEQSSRLINTFLAGRLATEPLINWSMHKGVGKTREVALLERHAVEALRQYAASLSDGEDEGKKDAI